MLKIFIHKFNNIITKNVKYESHYVSNNVYYPSAIKEWCNSIYVYNKNATKLLLVADKNVLKLIRGYFNLYYIKLERNTRLPKLPNWIRRFSLKRILISGVELKHTNDKLIITMYIYNRQKIYINNKIEGLIKNGLFIDRIRFIKEKTHDLLFNIKRRRNIILNLLKWKDNDIKVHVNEFLKKIIIIFLREIKLYMYYRQMLLLNELKFKDSNIIPLKALLEKIYNKKVEFNIISLKYYHLNTDIYLQILATKLRNRNNRIYKVLNRSLINIKLPPLHELILHTIIPEKKMQNLLINKLINYNKKEFYYLNDRLNNILYNYYNLNLFNFNNINNESLILNSVKYKTFGGIRVEATGRLSKRLVAARAVFKHKYIGNLRNVDSSYFDTSLVVLRGNLKSNLNYSKFKSKTKIGSYGLKSWINNI